MMDSSTNSLGKFNDPVGSVQPALDVTVDRCENFSPVKLRSLPHCKNLNVVLTFI